ncbi:MAG: hypothetical protein V4574_10515 [Pseudomonadota bacterium]
MTTQERILDLLPPIYTAAPDGIVAALIGEFALEFDVIQEDLDRLRRTHWINHAYRFEDARKIGALCGVAPLPHETLESFRARLLPLIKAQLAGALGPAEIRRFVDSYLREAEQAYEAVFVPGLARSAVDRFEKAPDQPFYRPPTLREFPPRNRRSAALSARGGLVPVLFRWTETNAGLEHAVPSFRITGLGGRKTAVPLIANLTTGEMIFYPDRLLAGAELEIVPDEKGDGRAARATLDGADVTAKLKSLSGFKLGTPFSAAQYDAAPRLPRLPRGPSEWVYLSVGLFDVRALDHMFFALADAELREGRFDETRFDHALFPSGPLARVEMGWTELEGASFEVDIPRTIVVEPGGAPAGEAPHLLVAEAIERSIAMLHAAGVRATVRFTPFVERQEQRIRHSVSWFVVDSERGSAGTNDSFEFGFHFEETGLGRARFE